MLGVHFPWGISIDLVDLQRVIREKLSVLSITLEDSDEDAPTIFEGINAKREELRQWDFVRNSLFVNLDPALVETIFNTKWDPVDSLVSETSYLGLRDDSRDAYLYDYLIASGEQKYQGTLSKTRGFQHLRTRITRIVGKPRDPDYATKLVKFIEDDFLRTARAWPMATGSTSVELPSRRQIDDEVRQTIESITHFSSSPPIPAILHYLSGYDRHECNLNELKRSLSMIDSLVARLVMAKCPLSPLRSLVMSLMGSIGDSCDPRDLKAQLVRMEAMPSNSDIEKCLTEEPLYGNGVTGPQLGAIFRGIERQLSGPAANPLPYGASDDDFTVEHVFPQSCSTRVNPAWKAEFTEWGVTDAAVSQVQARTDRIGNLTLLTLKTNKKLRAKAFSDKSAALGSRDGHEQHPSLRVNQAIVSSKRWTAVQIDKRTDKLVDAAVRRWPRVH